MHTMTTGIDAATIINRLGFTPQESLVLACTPTPPQGQGLIARLDLADLHEKQRRQVLAQLSAPLHRSGTTGVTVVYFTQADPGHLGQIDAEVDAMLAAEGITRTGTVLVDDPPNGTTRADLGVVPPAPGYRRARVAQGLAQGRTATFADYLEALQVTAQGRTLPADQVAGLITWLDDVHHRDAALALAVGASTAQARRVATGTGQGLQVVQVLFDPAHATRPGPHLRAHRDLLTQLVATAPHGRQVPARTLLAMLAWWQGNGALADRHLRQALQAAGEPYRLAHLLQAALEAGVPPAWVAHHQQAPAAQQTR